MVKLTLPVEKSSKLHSPPLIQEKFNGKLPSIPLRPTIVNRLVSLSHFRTFVDCVIIKESMKKKFRCQISAVIKDITIVVSVWLGPRFTLIWLEL